MLSSAALGELLIVGALPMAAILAIVAAILAARRPRLARVLMVSALLALVGMMITGRRLVKPLNEIRKQQSARFAPVKVGWTQGQVEDALGAADRRCPGEGAYLHKVRGTSELVSSLYASTTQRWIYFVPGSTDEESRLECQPGYGDGEVGFNAAGQVIWYIELTDETFLTF